MNRRPQVPKAASAIEGFLQTKQAEAISSYTLINYRLHLAIFAEFIGLQRDLAKVAAADVRAYLVHLRTTYVPRRVSTNLRRLSAKTLRNPWITLSSFFTIVGSVADEATGSSKQKGRGMGELHRPDSLPFRLLGRIGQILLARSLILIPTAPARGRVHARMSPCRARWTSPFKSDPLTHLLLNGCGRLRVTAPAASSRRPPVSGKWC